LFKVKNLVLGGVRNRGRTIHNDKKWSTRSHTKTDLTRKRRTKKRANKTAIFCEVGERKMANNVNWKEMRFVIRNLVDVDDVSPATAPEIPFDGCLNYVGISPKRKG
jgi:hypothetical protein